MVVYFISILVEAAKRIDLIVSAIGHRGIDQASGSLAEGAGDFGSVSVHHGPVLHGRIRHNEGIIGGRSGRRGTVMR